MHLGEYIFVLGFTLAGTFWGNVLCLWKVANRKPVDRTTVVLTGLSMLASAVLIEVVLTGLALVNHVM